MIEKALLPHQQRIVDEKSELDEKINKLQQFIETNDLFKDLHPAEKNDLVQQGNIMLNYSSVLQRRINRFNY